MPSADFYSNPICADQRSYLVEGSRYDIAHDVLWTFWKEEDVIGLKGGDMMAAYSTDRGLTWSTPQYISDHGDTSIGFKSVALMPGGKVAVNYEVPNFPTDGEIRVVYREQTGSIVGINEANQDPAGLSFFPNPTNDYITVQTRDNVEWKTVEIFSLLGEKLYSTPFDANVPIDLSALNTGVYIIKFVDKNGISQFAKKIIKI